MASQRWRPEQGVLSQGRGELKYLACQRRTIYKGSGHTGFRGKRGAWKVTVEGHCEPGSARRSQQVKAPPRLSAPAQSSRWPFGGPGARLLYGAIPQLLPPRPQSTYRVQGLEFLPQVSHSALLARVPWVPGTLFLQPVLSRCLQILALPPDGCG